MFWVVHRDLFSRVKTVNRDLVWLNLLFLLPVSLIPFAASVLGKYPDEPIALHLYGVVMIAATVMPNRPVLVCDPPAGAAVARRDSRTLWARADDRGIPIVVYALAMAAADVAAPPSIALTLSCLGSYFLLVTLLRERASTRAEADEFT